MVRKCINKFFLAMMVLILLLGATSLVQASPARGDEAVVPAYGCPATLDGSPIGGGVGYTTTYSSADVGTGDYEVDTVAELKYALAHVASGHKVFVSDGATILLTNKADMYSYYGNGYYIGFLVPAGVTLCGGRGRVGVTGGNIQVDAALAPVDWPTLIGCGTGAKICGLTLIGNSGSTDANYRWSGVVLGNNAEFCNNEIYDFPDWGVTVRQDVTGAWIHHNNIHHCRRLGTGYGVQVVAQDIYHTASVIVEGNTFDYCRHVIAGQDGLLDFIFRYNYLGANAAYEAQIDCHGNNDGGANDLAKDGGEYIYCAGRNLQIYNNTSVCAIENGVDEFVGIRGTPHSSGEISVHNNWLCATGRSKSNIIQWMFRIPEYGYSAPDRGSYVRMESYDNWYGTTPPPGVTPNSPPATPSTPSGTTSGQVGTAYTYQTVTTDPDGNQIRYTLDWGDDTASTTELLNSGVTASVSHTWTAAGDYWLYVQAADSHGAVSAKSSPGLRVTVVDSDQPVPTPNSPPATPATPSGPIRGQAGTAYTYQAVTTDPDGDAMQYTFDWGDDTSSTTELLDSGVAASVSHAWTIAGDYRLYVKATDSRGAVSARSTYGLHVKVVSPFQPSSVIPNNAPTAPGTPSGVAAGLTSTEYQYSAVTTDPDADQLLYTFDWGDGMSSTTELLDSGVTASASHAWAQPGTYAVQVETTDANGAVSASSSAVTVNVLDQSQEAQPVPPTPVPTAPVPTTPAPAVPAPATPAPAQGTSPAVKPTAGTPTDSSPVGLSTATVENAGGSLSPAVGGSSAGGPQRSGFVWWLLSVSVIVGAAVLLIGAIVRDTVSEPPRW